MEAHLVGGVAAHSGGHVMQGDEDLWVRKQKKRGKRVGRRGVHTEREPEDMWSQLTPFLA